MTSNVTQQNIKRNLSAGDGGGGGLYVFNKAADAGVKMVFTVFELKEEKERKTRIN